MIRNHDTFLSLEPVGKQSLTTYRAMSQGYLEMGSSTTWCVLLSFFLISLFRIYLCKHCSTFYFAASDRLELDSQYHDRIRAIFAFAQEIEDFDNLVNLHHLFDCCLGPEHIEYVLEKIYREEKIMFILPRFLMFCSFLSLITYLSPFISRDGH